MEAQNAQAVSQIAAQDRYVMHGYAPNHTAAVRKHTRWVGRQPTGCRGQTVL